MSTPAPLLAALLFIGPNGSLRAEQEPHIREILGVILETIELEPDDQVLAGKSLHPGHREALSRLIAGELPDVRETPEYLVPPNAVVIDDVKTSGRMAFVQLTYGPVPRVPGLQCGQAITMALRREANWEVDENHTWVKCANSGAPANSSNEERLREVCRLAMSQLRVEPRVRVVADPRLAPEARAMLNGLTEVAEAAAVQTPDFLLPPDHFKIHALTVAGEVATFEATWGPVPRHATRSCGTNVTMRLRRRSGGWFFEDITYRVC